MLLLHPASSWRLLCSWLIVRHCVLQAREVGDTSPALACPTRSHRCSPCSFLCSSPSSPSSPPPLSRAHSTALQAGSRGPHFSADRQVICVLLPFVAVDVLASCLSVRRGRPSAFLRFNAPPYCCSLALVRSASPAYSPHSSHKAAACPCNLHKPPVSASCSHCSASLMLIVSQVAGY